MAVCQRERLQWLARCIHCCLHLCQTLQYLQSHLRLLERPHQRCNERRYSQHNMSVRQQILVDSGCRERSYLKVSAWSMTESDIGL